MCTWCAYMSFTDYSPQNTRHYTKKRIHRRLSKKNTWRLHGITCRLTRSCKVHFAGKYPYLQHPNFHVYNMHCRKRSSLRECNPKNVHHCTCYLPLFDWMDWGTYNMYTAQWWQDVVINVYLMCLHVVYRILATTRKKGYIADSQKKHMTTSRDHLPFNKQLQSRLCR